MPDLVDHLVGGLAHGAQQVQRQRTRADARLDDAAARLRKDLTDLDAIEKRLFKAEKQAKAGDKKALEEVDFMKRLRDMLGKGEPLRRAEYTEEQAAWLKSYNLLSAKPVLYVANVSEDMIDVLNPRVDAVQRIAAEEGAKVVVISGQVEGEIAAVVGNPENARSLAWEAIFYNGRSNADQAAVIGGETYLHEVIPLQVEVFS